MSGYNYIDLFHGIGGFALGAYWAGMKFENHFCSDIEPYAQKLYKLRFPDSIQLGDITKIDTEELKQYGDKWIITGGFPCQDISIAGKGAGITGARSGLWFEYWRLIRDLRPEFAIMENVGALTFRGLDAVLGSLSEIGYNAELQDIRSSDLGAPHKRERIWIVAYPEGKQGACEQRTGIEQNRENGLSWEFRGSSGTQNKDVANTRCKLWEQRDTTGMEADKRQWSYCKLYTESGCKRQLPDTDNERRKEQHNGITERPGDINGCDVERKTEHPGWSTEPAVGRLVNGLPGRVGRLKGLGNAIVPQIAELLFNQIKELTQ